MQLKDAVKVLHLIFIYYTTWLISLPSWMLGVSIVRIFVNNALLSLLPLVALRVNLKEASSPKVSLLLSFVPHSLAGLFFDKGPRGEQSTLRASQLGLVYFPLLSNKRHFLVLMAWKASVIKIQASGVTKRETEPRLLQRPFIT